MEEQKMQVLVIGGKGYLGQHLLQALSHLPQYEVAFTHHSISSPPQLLLPNSCSFHVVDLQTGYGFNSISQHFRQPDVVVNCAALSVPRVCEKNPYSAMAVNVPSSLVKWLSSFQNNKNTLLIHLSTDQVYEGVKSFYKEEDETVPINVYGKSKVAAEKFIAEKCSDFAILRSSIIYGPQAVSPVQKSLPIQWIDGLLSKGEAVEFIDDEYRCPIYVKDVVHIILSLTNKWLSEGKQMRLVLNVGGPDRVSRVQMAEAVAQIRGYNTSSIKPVSTSTVDRGVQSPADTSVDISKLVETLKFFPTPFREGVRLTLQNNK